MAQVKIEDIMERLDYEVERALARTLANVAPEAVKDARALARNFISNFGMECSTWEKVPDQYVKVE